jgi:hypothetical protein
LEVVVAKKLILTIDETQVDVDASDLNSVEWKAVRALLNAKTNKEVINGIDDLELENICAVAAIVAKRDGVVESAKELFKELLGTLTLKQVAKAAVEVPDEDDEDDSPLNSDSESD